MTGVCYFKLADSNFALSDLLELERRPLVAQAPNGVVHKIISCPLTGDWQVDCRDVRPDGNYYVLRKLPRPSVELALLQVSTGKLYIPCKNNGGIQPLWSRIPASDDYCVNLHDCRGYDFSGQHISEDILYVDFQGADLTGTVWSGTDVSFCKFNGANIDRTFAVGATLTATDIRLEADSEPRYNATATVTAMPYIAHKQAGVEVWPTDLGLVFRWKSPTFACNCVGTLHCFLYCLANCATHVRATLAAEAFSAACFVQR